LAKSAAQKSLVEIRKSYCHGLVGISNTIGHFASSASLSCRRCSGRCRAATSVAHSPIAEIESVGRKEAPELA
jgi:hypothetical protein